jgi:DNA-binding PadR family transcriptional regulator
VSEGFVPGLRYRSPAQELWALVVESFGGWEERVNAAAAVAALSPARLRCNPSTVVDPTDRLEDGGLVVRQTHPVDRRVNVLVVTPKGRRVREDLIERLFDPPESFRGLSAKEQARFREVLLAAVGREAVS